MKASRPKANPSFESPPQTQNSKNPLPVELHSFSPPLGGSDENYNPPNHLFSQELISKAITSFEKAYGITFSEREATEVIFCLKFFLNTLSGWAEINQINQKTHEAA